ncbi:MAG: helix-hairpin-helix domain-containing protein, partial [Planctomycetaceae bacterium]
MHNAEIAQHFDELADLLEIQGANPFRVRAYRNAARIVGDLAEQVATVVGDPARKLDEIPGIGADLAAKITILAKTGVLPQLEEVRRQVPPGVWQMTRIPGLGPKKAAALHKELGLTTLEQLRAACEAGQVAGPKGFGKKTQQAILEGLEQVATAGQRLLLAEVEPVALELVAALREVPGVGQVEPAGSFRRRRESVGDLDILVTADNSAAAMQTLADHPRVAQVLSRGETKMRVRLKIGLEMDLRVVPKESYGAALQYFTGSKDHNIVMRRRAIERGLKLNEYGLFRDETPVAGETEAGVYAALDLP